MSDSDPPPPPQSIDLTGKKASKKYSRRILSQSLSNSSDGSLDDVSLLARDSASSGEPLLARDSASSGEPLLARDSASSGEPLLARDSASSGEPLLARDPSWEMYRDFRNRDTSGDRLPKCLGPSCYNDDVRSAWSRPSHAEELSTVSMSTSDKTTKTNINPHQLAEWMEEYDRLAAARLAMTKKIHPDDIHATKTKAFLKHLSDNFEKDLPNFIKRCDERFTHMIIVERRIRLLQLNIKKLYVLREGQVEDTRKKRIINEVLSQFFFLSTSSSETVPSRYRARLEHMLPLVHPTYDFSSPVTFYLEIYRVLTLDINSILNYDYFIENGIRLSMMSDILYFTLRENYPHVSPMTHPEMLIIMSAGEFDRIMESTRITSHRLQFLYNELIKQPEFPELLRETVRGHPNPLGQLFSRKWLTVPDDRTKPTDYIDLRRERNFIFSWDFFRNTFASLNPHIQGIDWPNNFQEWLSDQQIPFYIAVAKAMMKPYSIPPPETLEDYLMRLCDERFRRMMIVERKIRFLDLNIKKLYALREGQVTDIRNQLEVTEVLRFFFMITNLASDSLPSEYYAKIEQRLSKPQIYRPTPTYILSSPTTFYLEIYRVLTLDINSILNYDYFIESGVRLSVVANILYYSLQQNYPHVSPMIHPEMLATMDPKERALDLESTRITSHRLQFLYNELIKQPEFPELLRETVRGHPNPLGQLFSRAWLTVPDKTTKTTDYIDLRMEHNFIFSQDFFRNTFASLNPHIQGIDWPDNFHDWLSEKQTPFYIAVAKAMMVPYSVPPPETEEDHGGGVKIKKRKTIRYKKSKESRKSKRHLKKKR
jgi:hypothetical protein